MASVGGKVSVEFTEEMKELLKQLRVDFAEELTDLRKRVEELEKHVPGGSRIKNEA